MTSLFPTAAAIAVVRQRLIRFSCLTIPPDLSAVEAEQVRADIRDFNDWSDYQTLGICASTLAEAKQVGYTIAHSPLVKTALFASDPNWGRILAAVGRDQTVTGINERPPHPLKAGLTLVWTD